MKKSIIPCLDLKSMEIRSEKNIEVCRIEFAVFFLKLFEIQRCGGADLHVMYKSVYIGHH